MTASAAKQDTTFGVTLENRASERWHNLVRYAGLRFRSQYTNFGPTGIATTRATLPVTMDIQSISEMS